MKQRILVVDDDFPLSRMIGRELMIEGYYVITSEIFEDVLTLLNVESLIPIDVFVLDIMMRVPSKYYDSTDSGMLAGLVLAGEVRSKYPNAPIILWSSMSSESIVTLSETVSHSLGNVEIIRKGGPEAVKRLKSSIRKHLGKSKPLPKGQRAMLRALLDRVWNSVMLEPNISGIGIDLKILLGPERHNTP